MLSTTLDSAEHRLNSKPPSSTQSQFGPMVLSKSRSRPVLIRSGCSDDVTGAVSGYSPMDLWTATIGSTLESLQLPERDPKGS